MIITVLTLSALFYFKDKIITSMPKEVREYLPKTLSYYLQHPNVKKFIKLIHFSEGTYNYPNGGYNTMFTGKQFTSLADHPRIRNTAKINGKNVTSSAAGASQFLESTWDWLAKKYDLKDFSKTSQDTATVGLLIYRNAIDDIVKGNIKDAIYKCSNEWASFPGNNYDQNAHKIETLTKYYQSLK